MDNRFHLPGSSHPSVAAHDCDLCRFIGKSVQITCIESFSCPSVLSSSIGSQPLRIRLSDNGTIDQLDLCWNPLRPQLPDWTLSNIRTLAGGSRETPPPPTQSVITCRTGRNPGDGLGKAVVSPLHSPTRPVTGQHSRSSHLHQDLSTNQPRR